MKLPPNFAREPIVGHKGANHHRMDGWIVRVGTERAFVSRDTVGRPGVVRKCLEAVLGIKPKPPLDDVTRVIRQSAARHRSVRNSIAANKKAGVPWTPPWRRRRTLAAIRGEERLLAILWKLQNAGEYRK